MQPKPRPGWLNRKHPHAAGLVAAWRFDRLSDVLQEHIGKRAVSVQVGTFAGSLTGYGPAGGWTTALATDRLDYGDVLGRSGNTPFSLFAVVNPTTGGDRSIAARGGAASPNDVYEFKFYWNADAFGFYRTAGPTAGNAVSGGVYPGGKVYRVACTFDGVSAMKTYVNGTLAGSATYATSVLSTSTTPKFLLASDWGGQLNTYRSAFVGKIYDFRMWHRCLAPNEVASISADPWGMYRRRPLQTRGLNLGGAFTPADTTDPVVSGITPAEGVTRDPTTGTIGFTVTDSGGNLTRTTVYAYYPSTGAFEVVWYGTSFDGFTAGFAPQYTGTRTAVANGFAFSGVIRRGGWPRTRPGGPYSDVTIVSDDGDSAGNESA